MSSNGLNGWFGRLLKNAITFIANKVDDVISASTFGISSNIISFGELADRIGSGGSTFWNRTTNNLQDKLSVLENDPRASYEFTPTEQIYITKFNNDFADILADVKKNVLNFENTASFDNKLILANSLLQRIAVIKGYYASFNNVGLSYEAIQARNLLIEIMFFPLVDFIENEILKNQTHELVAVSTLVKPEKRLQELYPMLFYTAQDFNIKYYLFEKISTKDNSVLVPVESLPKEIIPDLVESDVIEPTTTPTKKKSGLGLFAGLLFGTAVLIVATSNDDKKKKQKQK